MIIKAAPSHRFITCQQGKKLLCTFHEEIPLEVDESGGNDKYTLDNSDTDTGIMSTDKIKHFYITVSATLTTVLLLLIFYGCCTYRKRRLENLNKRNEILARKRSRGLGDGQTTINDKHLHQKLINNNQ